MTFLCWKSELILLSLVVYFGWISLYNSIIMFLPRVYFSFCRNLARGNRESLCSGCRFNYRFRHDHCSVVANWLAKDSRL